MRKKLGMLGLLGLMTAVMGCESGSSGSSAGITFANQSTHNVTVTPNGQSGWEPFLLSPTQERTVDIGTTVYYLYGPNALVAATANSDGTVVTFTDRQ